MASSLEAGNPLPPLASSFLSDISLLFPHPHWAGYSSAGFPQEGYSSATLPHAGYFSSTALVQTGSYLAGGFSFFLGASSTFFSATTLTSFYGSGALGLITSTSFLGTIVVGLMTSLGGSSDFPQPCRSRGGWEITFGALVLAGMVVVVVEAPACLAMGWAYDDYGASCIWEATWWGLGPFLYEGAPPVNPPRLLTLFWVSTTSNSSSLSYLLFGLRFF